MTLLLVVHVATPVRAEQVTDALGRTAGGETVPQRIVSLVPAITEILYALGVEDRLVGVTSFCNYPEAARSKPRVGEYASPNLEVLTVMQPDMLFMSADNSSPEMLARFESLKIPVYIAYPKSIADTAGLIRSMGQLLERQAAAEALAAKLDRSVACAKQVTSQRAKVKVLCTVMSQPLVVAGRHTLLDDLVEVAGGVNVVPDGPNRYPTWGIESVLAADPDVILVSPHPGQSDPSAFYRNWTELNAVKNERLKTIEADWIQRPGPRLAHGLAAMVEALHGIEINVEGGTCTPH
jgi:iron complex transport system substrate-binding protein